MNGVNIKIFLISQKLQFINSFLTQNIYNFIKNLKDILMEKFIQNLKLAGGEVLDTIPNDWYQAKAKFGVAENGSVFVSDYTKELFLSENVVITLDKNEIYEKMTDVMEKVEDGVFISGPSKTADVESFLVLGAHGPMKLGIYLKG